MWNKSSCPFFHYWPLFFKKYNFGVIFFFISLCTLLLCTLPSHFSLYIYIVFFSIFLMLPLYTHTEAEVLRSKVAQICIQAYNILSKFWKKLSVCLLGSSRSYMPMGVIFLLGLKASELSGIMICCCNSLYKTKGQTWYLYFQCRGYVLLIHYYT